MPPIITVFGGSGFIGRSVVQRLAQRDVTIIVPTRNPSDAQFLKNCGRVGQIIILPCTLADDAALATSLQGAEAAINLVGILFESGKNTFKAVHAELPGRIAAAARQAGVKRLVHLSAIGADAASAAAYARSKARGEQAVQAAFPAATILRPSVVFGADDNFLNMFAAMAKISPVLPLIGGGHTRFQPVYVDDVAAAIIAALDRPQAEGKIYELGGPQIYSFRQLLAYLLTVIRRKRWLLPLPWSIATLQAALLQLLPHPLLTVDQVRLLRTDNIVAPNALGLKALELTPTALELIAPGYLARHRPAG